MPLGKMRRTDRQMSQAESEEFLAQALVGRIGTVGPEGMPYVLPMSFAYDPTCRTVFLHHATHGHLLENLAHSSSACFEVDEAGDIIATGRRACDTGQVYRSVICFGRARILADEREKEGALRLLVRKYIDNLTPDRDYDRRLAGVDGTTVIALQVEVMTGKRRSAG